MNELWREFSADFNAMSDEEVDFETRVAQDLIDENTEWVEAVASWLLAGRPRNVEQEPK